MQLSVIFNVYSPHQSFFAMSRDATEAELEPVVSVSIFKEKF
jgi:alkylated DNA repair dioxygenase AlkB